MAVLADAAIGETQVPRVRTVELHTTSVKPLRAYEVERATADVAKTRSRKKNSVRCSTIKARLDHYTFPKHCG